MAQSLMDRRYSTRVWAGTACAAILAVSAGASLWVFFGQGRPLLSLPTEEAAPIHAGLAP